MQKTLLTILCGLGTLSAFSQSTLNRPNDPVILTGAQLSGYATAQPNSLVAFKYVSGTWVQIPIQVDERELKDIVTGYGALATAAGFPPSASNPKVLFYSDANTNVGADSSPLFDADDELVFMAKDAGGISGSSANPTGTVAGSCTQVTITDPLGGVGYVYIFRQDGSLQQGAGVSYVNYSSNVSTVTGWPAHVNGSNAENTSVSTSNYSWHISGEWISDELKLALGTNVDILDRHKSFFANGYCGRSEDTFTAAENAYLTAKAGPIRIIRSIMGANSGPLTQRTHVFYQGRFDIVTDLRVHSIPSIFDAFDYNAAANGMVYSNNINGVTTATINGTGTADGLNVNAMLEWEQLTGTQGTLSILHRSVTNINSVPSDNTTFLAYYDDNSTAPLSTCTGDGQAWGSSGWGAVFTGGITTDPLNDAGAANLRNLRAIKIGYPGAANLPTNTASNYDAQYDAPLQIATSACVTDGLTASLDITPISCVGGLANVLVNDFGSVGTVHYSWSHDNSITGNTANVPAGNYTVVVSDDNDSISIAYVIVAPTPIDTSLTVLFTTLTSNQDSATYVWINCGTNQFVPNAIGQSLQVPNNGTYAVIITNQNGCVDTSACIEMYPYGIKENALAQFITLFPNPVTSTTILSIEYADIADMRYSILDITGRIIQQHNITNKQTHIDLSTLANGTYTIIVNKASQPIRAIKIMKY